MCDGGMGKEAATPLDLPGKDRSSNRINSEMNPMSVTPTVLSLIESGGASTDWVICLCDAQKHEHRRV